MPRRKPQARPDDVASYVALRTFHHPAGVALPGQSVQLRAVVASRAIRTGHVRPASPAPRQSTVQPSTEETA